MWIKNNNNNVGTCFKGAEDEPSDRPQVKLGRLAFGRLLFRQLVK